MRTSLAIVSILSAVACHGAVAAVDYQRLAMERDGDAVRGKALFEDEQRLACSRCHSVDGKGGKAGPDLFAAGDQFPRRGLIEAVVHPSAAIAVGYGTTIVQTKSEEDYAGVLKESSADWVELACGDGTRRRLNAPGHAACGWGIGCRDSCAIMLPQMHWGPTRISGREKEKRPPRGRPCER